MKGFIIRDGTEPGGRGGLEFDLAELLAALGPRALDAVWHARDVTYVSTDDRIIEPFERLESAEGIPGAELISILPELRQIIDGEFEARMAPGSLPWVRLRAFDSSWWEVYSDDANVLGGLRARFRVIESLPGAA